MRVIHVTSGLGSGGAEAVLYRLISSDRTNQHFVISLAEDDGFYSDQLRLLGVQVHYCRLKGLLSIPSVVLSLSKTLRLLKPDVIQTWMYHGSLVGSLAACLSGSAPVFWSLHATTLNYPGFPLSTILISRILAVFSYFSVKKIIYCSESSIKVHVGYGYKKSLTKLIYNGIDTHQFKPSLEVCTGKGSPFVIGHVSRFHPMKDLENLLESLSLVDSSVNFELHLYGGGFNVDNRDFVEILNKYSISNRVKVFGISRDLPNVYPTFNLFILSSAFGESLPNVLSEAMSCGVPCITTSIGDSGVIVGNTGWVVESKNPEELSRCILTAYNEFSSSADWSRRQENCRLRIIDNFSVDVMVGEYIETWECLTDE